jgi:hypothetical protein
MEEEPWTSDISGMRWIVFSPEEAIQRLVDCVEDSAGCLSEHPQINSQDISF